MISALRRVARTVASAPRIGVVGVIRGYQLVISPLTGPRCKYYPSCSHYGIEAVQTHGAVKGSTMAAWRILRCNPWSNGGVDDVPAQGERLFRLRRNNAAMLTEVEGVTTLSPRLHSQSSN